MEERAAGGGGLDPIPSPPYHVKGMKTLRPASPPPTPPAAFPHTASPPPAEKPSWGVVGLDSQDDHGQIPLTSWSPSFLFSTMGRSCLGGSTLNTLRLLARGFICPSCRPSAASTTIAPFDRRGNWGLLGSSKETGGELGCLDPVFPPSTPHSLSQRAELGNTEAWVWELAGETAAKFKVPAHPVTGDFSCWPTLLFHCLPLSNRSGLWGRLPS